MERELVQVLADKVRAANAQKGMLFSTNGFQRGAIDYARSHSIALVRVVEGALTYETRRRTHGSAPERLLGTNLAAFVGQVISGTESGTVHTSLVDYGRTETLLQFLQSA